MSADSDLWILACRVVLQETWVFSVVLNVGRVLVRDDLDRSWTRCGWVWGKMNKVRSRILSTTFEFMLFESSIVKGSSRIEVFKIYLGGNSANIGIAGKKLCIELFD